MPRARTRERGKKFVTPELLNTEPPAEVDDRAVPGHWEGDLILGLDSSAIGTLVERTTRFTMLLHLPRMEGHGHGLRVKNGPALAGHGAEAARDEIARVIATLPEQLRRSLTWDQGAEMDQHAQLKIDSGLEIYFCDRHSPWQRGTNENTNGLLRQYFPKGTDLSRHPREDLDAIALALNTRSRKTSAGRHPPKLSTSSYYLPDSTALLRLLEPKEYTGDVFPEACAGLGAIQSMGRVGSALDNAAAESFNSTFERELLSRRRLATKDQARREVAAFIDASNHRRRHSSAEMMAPAAYEQVLADRAARGAGSSSGEIAA